LAGWLAFGGVRGCWAGAVVPFPLPFPGFRQALAALARHLEVIVAAGVLAAACFGAGRPLLAFLRRGGVHRAAFAAPLGAGGLALALAGLLFVGLWFPVVLAVLAVASIAVAVPEVRSWRCRQAGPREGLTAAGWAALVVGVSFLPWLLAPETHDDGWAYFLAAPSAWLAGHGLALRGGYSFWHLPLLFESLYSIPLLVGLDQVPKWLNAGIFLCGVLALLRPAERGRMGWGIALALCSVSSVVLATGKDEGALAGFGMLSYASFRAGAPVLGGVFAGFALGTKLTAAVNLCWIPIALVFAGGGLRRSGALLTGFLAAFVVAVPMYLKTWLTDGNPFFPLMGGNWLWAVPGWDQRNAEMGRAWTGLAVPSWKAVVAAAHSLIRENAALAWLAPAVLVLRGEARRIVASGLATWLAWHLFSSGSHIPRLAFPALAPALVCAGAAFPNAVSFRFAPAIFAVLLSLSCVGRLGYQLSTDSSCWNPDPLPYFVGDIDAAGHSGRGLTTIVDARDWLAGQPRSGRVLMVGEIRTYGMRTGIVAGLDHSGAMTPQPWGILGESSDASGVLRKLRQLGVDRLAYNPVRGLATAEALAPFSWTDREIALWRDVFGRWFELVHAPPRVDQRHGGLYFYSLRRRPLRSAPGFIMHLPGAGALLAPSAAATDPRKALREARTAMSRAPGVGEFMNGAAYAARRAGLNTLACQLYRGPFMAGQIDDENAIGFGVAAFVEGNLDDALAAFGRASAVNPDYSALAREYAMRTRFRLALRLARTSPSAALSAAGKAMDLPDGSPAIRSVLEALGTVLAKKGFLPPSDMAKFGDIDREMVSSAKIAARK